jgi:DNA-binding transcriptional ArsR family regulator
MAMARPQDVLRRLGDPTRLRVLTSLLAGRKNVSQIVAELGLSQPQVSYHLRMLREARLATEERDGRWIWYTANWSSGDGHVRELLTLLAGWSGGRAPAGERGPRPGGRPGTRRKAAGAAPARDARDADGESGPAGEDRPAVERPRRPAPDMDDFLL